MELDNQMILINENTQKYMIEFKRRDEEGIMNGDKYRYLNCTGEHDWKNITIR